MDIAHTPPNSKGQHRHMIKRHESDNSSVCLGFFTLCSLSQEGKKSEEKLKTTHRRSRLPVVNTILEPQKNLFKFSGNIRHIQTTPEHKTKLISCAFSHGRAELLKPGLKAKLSKFWGGGALLVKRKKVRYYLFSLSGSGDTLESPNPLEKWTPPESRPLFHRTPLSHRGQCDPESPQTWLSRPGHIPESHFRLGPENALPRLCLPKCCRCCEAKAEIVQKISVDDSLLLAVFKSQI